MNNRRFWLRRIRDDSFWTGRRSGTLVGTGASRDATDSRRRCCEHVWLGTTFRPLAISAALMVAIVLTVRNSSEGANISQTLGHQAFPNGTKVGTATFAAAHVGDPAPFDGTFLGNDISGPNLSANWMFTYGAISDSITAAALTLGIYDCDSAASGNQVASFLLNGSTDLTVPLNAAFEANPSPTGFVNDYTITLPASAFSQLATGSSGFALILHEPGLGVLGETQFNGGALDFSTITITTQPVPEPDSVILLFIGAMLLLVSRHLRRVTQCGPQ